MALSRFRPIRTKTGYAAWLAELAGMNGVYVIRRKARRGQAALMLYVGESHTHRLRETLQRHYQQWTGHTAGPTFDAKDTEVAVEVFLLGEDAVQSQNRLIRRYEPIHNVQIPAPEGVTEPKQRRTSKRRSEEEAYDDVAAFFEDLAS